MHPFTVCPPAYPDLGNGLATGEGDAAGFRVEVRLTKKPRPVSAEYIAVMQMAGELAGKRETLPPLEFPYEVWRTGDRLGEVGPR